MYKLQFKAQTKTATSKVIIGCFSKNYLTFGALILLL